jgi:hypothetical protein
VVYLTSTTAWSVTLVVHEMTPIGPCLEVWLDYVGASRQSVDRTTSNALH